MYSSYRDALLLGKTVEQPVKARQFKPYYPTFHTSDIKKCVEKAN
jgi:hypothetical protein